MLEKHIKRMRTSKKASPVPLYSHRSGITIPTPKERKQTTSHRRSQAVRNLEQNLSEKPATVSKVPDSCDNSPEEKAPQTSFT